MKIKIVTSGKDNKCDENALKELANSQKEMIAHLRKRQSTFSYYNFDYG